MSYTHQICERCWFNGPGKIDANSVRLPVQVKDANAPDGIGTCHFCMQPCVTGIFIRHSPVLLECADLHDPDD